MLKEKKEQNNFHKSQTKASLAVSYKVKLGLNL
jgi:hypothetical protein